MPNSKASRPWNWKIWALGDPELSCMIFVEPAPATSKFFIANKMPKLRLFHIYFEFRFKKAKLEKILTKKTLKIILKSTVKVKKL